MEKIFESIDTCRSCRSKDIEEILDLGKQPPANSLYKSKKNLPPSVPLRLFFCKKCSTLQLGETVDPKYLFQEYLWVTGTSATANIYSNVFTKNVLSRTNINQPFVIEIASNDGTFLKSFAEDGCEILGIDPAKNIAGKATKDGIPTLNEFFNAELARKLKVNKGMADVIFARNVIPHVKDIHSILEGIKALMHENSLGVIEFHEAGLILKELHYDSIYHEHLFYFSLKTISKLLEKYDLKVFDITDSPISGGSWVIYFSKIKKHKTNELKKVEKLELETGINNIQSWRNFAVKALEHSQKLKNMVRRKNKILAYGASARSSTLLNICGINSLYISAIIDKNPLKHGLYTPGSNIPIISFEQGKEIIKNENKVLLLAWNFEDEVVSDLRKAGFKGEIIVPLPNDPHIIHEVY